MNPAVNALISDYDPDCFHQEGLSDEAIQGIKDKIREAQQQLKERKSLSPELEQWCGMFRQQYLAFDGSMSRSSRSSKRACDPAPASDTNSQSPSKKRASDPAPAPQENSNGVAETTYLTTVIRNITSGDVNHGPVTSERLSELQKQLSSTADFTTLPEDSIKDIIALVKLASSDKHINAVKMRKLAAMLQIIRSGDLSGCSVTPENLAELQKLITPTTDYHSLPPKKTEILLDLLLNIQSKACGFLEFINPLSLRLPVPPTEDDIARLRNVRAFLSEARRLASESGKCTSPRVVIEVMHCIEDKQLCVSPMESTAQYENKITTLFSTCYGQSRSAPSPLLRERLSFYIYENPGLLDVIVSMMTPNA